MAQLKISQSTSVAWETDVCQEYHGILRPASVAGEDYIMVKAIYNISDWAESCVATVLPGNIQNTLRKITL